MDCFSESFSSKNDSGKRNSFISLSFHDLPTDVLLYIFKFSDLKTLFCLSCCCKRFYDIISNESVWISRSKIAVITNQSSEDVVQRSSKCLTAKQKCRISVNWKLGSYTEKYFLSRIRFMPKLLLERNKLWMSKGENIHAFRRQGKFVQWKKPLCVLSGGHDRDICNFVKLDSLLLTGGRDGRICGWSELTGELFFNKNCHGSFDIRCIDASGDILVSGSRDSILKVWRLNDNKLSHEPVSVFDVRDSVWSVACEPINKYICCGTTGLSVTETVNLFDLERGHKAAYSLKKGVAIFDIKWETPSTFLTCGYDSVLRLWDIRTNRCVDSWMDPFDGAGYCIASDKCNSVLCGTANNGRVQLWDLRMKLSVQSFFCTSRSSSPVYSVMFDPCTMFATLDKSLNVLDFSGDLMNKRDYSCIWGG